ncbi:MAG: adenylate/guanylate cyclase domain-containing protein [Dongiaceae bacterium]
MTTILSADAAEYSRLMRADEERTFRALQLCRRVIDRLVEEHQGRIFGTAGDGLVAEFASPIEALRCAAEIQQAIEITEQELPNGDRMRFRIGINIGDVLIADSDLIGDGVNVADRIQHLAQPGGICIAAGIYELVKSRPDFAFDDLGSLTVKNIADPVHVYRARMIDGQAAKVVAPSRKPRGRRLTMFITAAGALVVVVVGLWSYVAYLHPAAIQNQPKQPTVAQFTHASIAVLPFDNLSGDSTQDYFAEGITEDMTQALGRFSDLSVIAREAVQQYKGRALRPGELSGDLGVRYALQGSVRRDGDRVRVTATLSDATTGVQLWSDRYDGEVKDVFAVQDDITQKVVGALAIKLNDIERQRSLAKPPENLQAYDYLQRGREFFRRNTRADIRSARKLFEQAIALDPNYASAYVDLAATRVLTVTSGWTEQTFENLSEAEKLVRKALELDRNNAAAHAVLADIYLNRQQYDLARAEDDQAIALNPNDAWSHASRGGVLAYSGEPEEAVKSFEIAMQLNPAMDIVRQYSVGWAYYLVRRYEEAARLMEIGLRDNPSDYFSYACLAASYAQLDRMEDASRAAAGTLRNWPFFRIDVFASQFKREADRALVAEGLRKAGLK